MVTNHTVCDLAGRTQFYIRHPVNDAVAKLKVQPSVVWVPEVAHKILKLDAPGLCPVPPVFPDDARGNLMPVPRFEARVVNKFILKSRNQSFEGIPHNKKLEVRFQAKEKKRRYTGG